MDDVLETGGAEHPAGRRPVSAPADLTATFSRDSLGQVCALVRSAGADVGLTSRAIEDLLISVSEIVTNAICHGGGRGSITLRRLGEELLTEIRDNGPGLSAALVAAGRSAAVPAEGGLRRAQLLCGRVEVLSSSQGVTVRIFTPCPVGTCPAATPRGTEGKP